MFLIWYSENCLSQLSTELFLYVVNQLVHYSVDSLVVESLVWILQDEIDSIRFFPLREILSLIDIEQLYALKQFLLCVTGNALYLRKLCLCVNQQREVAANGWELAHFLIMDGMFLDGLA